MFNLERIPTWTLLGETFTKTSLPFSTKTKKFRWTYIATIHAVGEFWKQGMQRRNFTRELQEQWNLRTSFTNTIVSFMDLKFRIFFCETAVAL